MSFGESVDLHCSERCREEGCSEELHFGGAWMCVMVEIEK